MPNDPSSTAARLEVWRETILNWLGRSFFLGALVLMAVLVPPLVRAGIWGAPALLGAVTLAFGVCAFGKGPVRVRARGFLITLSVWVTVAPYAGGISGGIGLSGGVIVIFGVVLLGRRDAIVLAAFILGMWWLWWARRLWGLVPPPEPTFADMGRPDSAFRVVLTALLMLPVCLVATDYLIRKLTDTLGESEQLLKRVREHMAALENEIQRREQAEKRLLVAQKMELLAQLAGGVAHDVNNNLTIVRSSADLLALADGSPAERMELTAAISEACDNAAALTRQLLAIGRRDVVRREVVSVRETLEHMRRMLRSALRRDIDMDISAPETLPNVSVDPGQLQQAILNLVLNARDAMQKGGVLTVFVDNDGPTPAYDLVSSEKAPPQPVRIHVRDEGSGMTPETLHRIFDPFFTTKPAGVGSGLGIPMVCAFLEANGGRLGVRTRPGVGSTFTLELPATSEATKPMATATRALPSGTILVVEDDDRVRAVVSRVLREAGFATVDVATGEEALAYAEGTTRIDLLCTDARLPRLQGEELVRRFRAARPRTPILMCTAYVDDARLRSWIEDQALPAVRKPFAREELLRAVTSALASTPRALPDGGAESERRRELRRGVAARSDVTS